jgi:hypothetical protein
MLLILRSTKLLPSIQTIAANSFILLILVKENREPSLLNSKQAFTGRKDLYVSYKYKSNFFLPQRRLHTCLTKMNTICIDEVHRRPSTWFICSLTHPRHLFYFPVHPVACLHISVPIRVHVSALSPDVLPCAAPYAAVTRQTPFHFLHYLILLQMQMKLSDLISTSSSPPNQCKVTDGFPLAVI